MLSFVHTLLCFTPVPPNICGFVDRSAKKKTEPMSQQLGGHLRSQHAEQSAEVHEPHKIHTIENRFHQQDKSLHDPTPWISMQCPEPSRTSQRQQCKFQKCHPEPRYNQMAHKELVEFPQRPYASCMCRDWFPTFWHHHHQCPYQPEEASRATNTVVNGHIQKRHKFKTLAESNQKDNEQILLQESRTPYRTPPARIPCGSALSLDQTWPQRSGNLKGRAHMRRFQRKLP